LVGAGLLFLASLVLLGENYSTWPGCFNSDDLYTVALTDSILDGNVSLVGWCLPIAPYFFPDLPLLLLSRLFVSNLAVLFLTYSILFYSLLAGALAWVGRECGLSWSRGLLTGLLGLALLFVVSIDVSAEWRGAPLYHAGTHAGVILLGLCIFALVARGLRQGGSVEPMT
jgi:hypothetical protein